MGVGEEDSVEVYVGVNGGVGVPVMGIASMVGEGVEVNVSERLTDVSVKTRVDLGVREDELFSRALVTNCHPQR